MASERAVGCHTQHTPALASTPASGAGSLNAHASRPPHTPLLLINQPHRPPPGKHQQVDFLRRLNRSGRSDAVVSVFESGNVACTEGSFGEYVRALVRMDALDNSRLLSTLQRGAEASFAGRGAAAAGAGGFPPPAAGASPAGAGGYPWYAAASGGGGYGGGGGGPADFRAAAAAALAAAGISNAAGGAAGEIGSARNPLVVTHAEPSFMSQV
jgi:hypothetical protein